MMDLGPDPIGPGPRILAALRGLAAGDAIGRVTEYYQPAEIAELYEDAITDFEEPVRLLDDEEWAAGETGSPTALVLALPETLAEAARRTDAGVGDLPLGVGLGLALPLARIADGGITDPALAAIAAAVSAAVEGHPASEVLAAAAGAARRRDPALAERIMAAAGAAQASGGRRPGEALRDDFPPGGETADLVAFALGIAFATRGARRAILEAANQGGHAPETAAVAGAICAALTPGSLPTNWAETVERVNEHDFETVAHRFVAPREGGTGSGTREG